MPLSKQRRLMFPLFARNGYVVLTSDDGKYVADEGDEPVTTTYMPEGLFKAFDGPKVFTVTIEPGDQLNG